MGARPPSAAALLPASEWEGTLQYSDFTSVPPSIGLSCGKGGQMDVSPVRL